MARTKALALALWLVSAAIACGTTKGGGSATSDGGLLGDAGLDASPMPDAAATTEPDADSCVPHRVPKTASGTLSIATHGTSFGEMLPDGGPSADAWMLLGYNLDGLCTATTDTNVCSTPDGGSRDAQQDGVNGTDNTFAHVIVPLVKQLTSPTFFRTAAVFVDITDGVGSVFVGGNAMGLTIPVAGATVATSASGGGTFSGIVQTDAFVGEVRALAGRQAVQLCTGGPQLDPVLALIEASSDIGADGTQTAGSACTGISIAFSFDTSESASPPSPLPDPCSQ